MIRSNAAGLAAKWAQRAKQTPIIMEKATKDATYTLLTESKKQMKELIYDKPVPTRAQVAAEKGRLSSSGKVGVMFGAATKSGAKKSVGFVLSKKSSGKPAWKRTGNLKRSEKAHVVNPNLGLVTNAAKAKKGGRGYAAIRHDMKSRFPAPWRANAIKITRPKIRKIYQEAIRRALIGGSSQGRMAAGGGS